MQRLKLIGIVFGCLTLSSAGQATLALHQQSTPDAKRPVTVADTISMTTLGDRYHRLGHDLVTFSPDGSKFAFVIQKGNLKSDTVEFSLLVFKTAEALTAPTPAVVVTLASSSNNEAISHLTWLADNDTLVFLGEQPGEPRQLYRVSSTTKKMEKLTNSPTPIFAYAVSDGGSGFVYIAEVSSEPDITKQMQRRGFFVTTQPWDTLYAPRPRIFDTRKELFYKTPQMDAPLRIGGVFEPHRVVEVDGLMLSPNGQYALIPAYVVNPPPIWAKYKLGVQAMSFITTCASGDAFLCPQQFLLADFEKASLEPFLNAPIVRGIGSTAAAWTRQNTVLMVNALLPLDAVDGDERKRRASQLYALEVKVPAREITKIIEQQVLFPSSRIRSDLPGGRFIAQPYSAEAGPAMEFRNDSQGWRVSTTTSSNIASEGQLLVTLEQGINSPPRLLAQDAKSLNKTILFDLNPQFAQLKFGRVEIVRWKTRDGRNAEGDLYYPPNYVSGQRYPLVIQTHGNSREEFWIEGPFTTAFAAQPLANRGFLVLQMGLGDRYDKDSLADVTKVLGTPTEGAYSHSFLEAAIDELDHQGLIDRDRVALSGFSRTVYHTLYTLTHSKRRISAAVIADGVDFGYASCLFYSGINSLCETMNGGGPPFGASLAGWVSAAPTFNLDMIQAPLLLQAIGAPLVEWEIFAGLRWLNKPVEMLNFYPEGFHELIRPQQRLLSQGSVVDWYCFWLKGEEDPDPSKAEQYLRWRRMRDQTMTKGVATH